MKKTILVLLTAILYMCLTSSIQAGEYLNKNLPKWFNADLELRHRFEWRSNFDFNDNVDDDDGFNLWRAKLGLSFKPTDNLKLFYQFQDARISDDSTSGSKATFEDWAETKQLWVEGQTNPLDGDVLGLTAVGAKFGRQELSFGNQRLIGAVNWSNVSQVFDAGKVNLKFDQAHFNVDIFGGGKVLIKSPREQNDFFDGSANDRIGGYYAVYSGLKETTIDQYVINRNTDGKTVSFGQSGDGEVEDYTIGTRVKGKIPETPFDYEVEVAKQIGNSGDLDANAQMAVAILGYTFNDAWKPRLGFEFDYASGDSHSTDGKRKTFDNLYPTNHQFYGYMDFVSLQNINNYRFQLNAFPTKQLELETNLHLIYLDTPKDSLYGANQLIKRATVAGADNHVGNELDLLVKYKFCSYANVWVGYSHLFAGDYLKSTGASDDANFAYAQTTISF